MSNDLTESGTDAQNHPRADRGPRGTATPGTADQHPHPATAESGRAFQLRRSFGALALPGVFIVMILGTALLDPLDDSASEHDTIVQAAGHANQLVALGWAEIATALLTLAGLLSLVGRTRARGAGLANATGVLAAIAAVGMVGIAVNHFVVSGLTRSTLTLNQKVEALTQFHHSGGPIIAFIFLGVLGFITAAITAWRSGLSHKLVLVPAAAFLVLAFAPGQVAEYGSYLAGLLMATWIARDLLRTHTTRH